MTPKRFLRSMIETTCINFRIQEFNLHLESKPVPKCRSLLEDKQRLSLGEFDHSSIDLSFRPVSTLKTHVLNHQIDLFTLKYPQIVVLLCFSLFCRKQARTDEIGRKSTTLEVLTRAVSHPYASRIITCHDPMLRPSSLTILTSARGSHPPDTGRVEELPPGPERPN